MATSRPGTRYPLTAAEETRASCYVRLPPRFPCEYMYAITGQGYIYDLIHGSFVENE